MSWDREFKKAQKEINMELLGKLRRIAKVSLEKIIDNTTVGNPSQWKRKAPRGYVPGKLKGNWVASLGGQKSIRNDAARDATGSKTKAKLRKVISQLRMNTALYFTNSQPYAAEVENGGRRNRPRGMVKRVKAGFRQLVQRAVRR